MRISNRSDFRHCSRKCRRNHLEPPCTDPYARWCGRGRRVTAAPMPIIASYQIAIKVSDALPYADLLGASNRVELVAGRQPLGIGPGKTTLANHRSGRAHWRRLLALVKESSRS